jgi:hypothetical protein
MKSSPGREGINEGVLVEAEDGGHPFDVGVIRNLGGILKSRL